MPHDDPGTHKHGPRDGIHTGSTADLADERPAGFDADPAERPRAPFNDALPPAEPGDDSPSHRPPELDATDGDAGRAR